MLDDPGQLKKLVDGGATFMDVLSYLTSAVGPQDAQATTETVQAGRLAQSFGTSLPADEVQAGLCRDSVPR
jgi:hypothetical protein